MKERCSHFDDDMPRLLGLTLGVAVSQALRAAVEWSLFDLLYQSPNDDVGTMETTTLQELAARVSNRCDPNDLLRILRLLAASGLVTEQYYPVAGSPSLPRFQLTRLGTFFVTTTNNDSEARAVPGTSMVKYILDDALWNAWTKLPEATSSSEGATAFELANGGQRAADYYGRNPTALYHANAFVRMISNWEIVTCATVGDGVWDNAVRVIDLGGNRGETLQAIQDEYPHLDCICLDLPEVVERSETQSQSSLSSSRIRLVGGDMFDSSTIPSCDTIFMKHILLCEFDEWDSKRILKSCSEALSPGGRVVVAESVLRDITTTTASSATNDHEATALLPFQIDVFLMLAGGEGRQRSRTESEWSDFLANSDSGFVLDRIVHTPCPTCSIMVLRQQ